MKSMSLVLFALGGLLVASYSPPVNAQAAAPAAAPAAAAPAAAPAEAGAPGGGVSYKAKTVYDFDDDLVEGDLIRPDGDLVDSRGKAKHSSLIKIRENFIPELLKSVESI